MAQIAVAGAYDKVRAGKLQRKGFRWCKKHSRWEKNSRKIDRSLVRELRDEGFDLTVRVGKKV